MIHLEVLVLPQQGLPPMWIYLLETLKKGNCSYISELPLNIQWIYPRGVIRVDQYMVQSKSTKENHTYITNFHNTSVSTISISKFVEGKN